MTISGGTLTRAISGSVERTASHADGKRECDGCRQRKPPILQGCSEHDGREPDERPDREIDAASDDDGREGKGEEAQLHGQPGDLEKITDRGKPPADDREQNDLGTEEGREYHFAAPRARTHAVAPEAPARRRSTRLARLTA